MPSVVQNKTFEKSYVGLSVLSCIFRCLTFFLEKITISEQISNVSIDNDIKSRKSIDVIIEQQSLCLIWVARIVNKISDFNTRDGWSIPVQKRPALFSKHDHDHFITFTTCLLLEHAFSLSSVIILF